MRRFMSYKTQIRYKKRTCQPTGNRVSNLMGAVKGFQPENRKIGILSILSGRKPVSPAGAILDPSLEGNWTSVSKGSGHQYRRDLNLSLEGIWTSVSRGSGPQYRGDLDISIEGIWTSVSKGSETCTFYGTGLRIIPLQEQKNLLLSAGLSAECLIP